MVNTHSCDKCIHINVCGKMDKYEKFIDAVNDLSITNGDNMELLYIKDSASFILNFGCKHFDCVPTEHIK